MTPAGAHHMPQPMNVELKIETQNTNVGACRFYERQGCELRAIHRAAYPQFPEEIQLLWYKDLRRG
jgi:hypothetical protein